MGKKSIFLYFGQVHHYHFIWAKHLYFNTLGKYIGISLHEITLYLSTWAKHLYISLYGQNICIYLYMGKASVYLSTWHSIYIYVLWASTSLSLYMTEHLYIL
ncbi:hypothetical protein BDB01DRAFT_803558 [Pilobolus umbonatus]|nr:hypothetical protein BDB01DRAFT_803558 [Pilobolus umbonatus]